MPKETKSDSEKQQRIVKKIYKKLKAKHKNVANDLKTKDSAIAQSKTSGSSSSSDTDKLTRYMQVQSLEYTILDSFIFIVDFD